MMSTLTRGEALESTPPASRGMLSHQPLPMRRRRSKGTIAGFAHGVASDDDSMIGDNMTSSDATTGGSGQGNQPQHVADSGATPLTKPCVSGRLALMSCQNAIRMGARTQLALCPPGRARRSLQSALRSRVRSESDAFHPPSSLKGDTEMGGFFGLDKMLGPEALAKLDGLEEDFLLSSSHFEGESDEEASSGDEDELFHMEDLISFDDSPLILDDEKKYAGLREPLFSPSGIDPALADPKVAPTSTSSFGKLPFNRRKLYLFDSISASDFIEARKYLKEQVRLWQRRNGVLLARRLRRIHRREKRRAQLERDETPDFETSEDEAEDPVEQALLTGGVSKFPKEITVPMSAALVFESLSMNPLESVEGMSKCYDGIAAAGLALLESQDAGKRRSTRAEVVSALAPLLITSLEQASGEVVLQLARLRRMCGTARYQRRFVQRVAPCLIRPPQAAMWCPRHQNDMEAILAATELIFDSAFDIFSKGWYDRGQLLLADSARRETLKNAALQLKSLSTERDDNHSLGLGATSSHGLRRGKKLVKGSSTKDPGAREALAEWEVIAVDRQIRISISNIVSRDWSRVVVTSRDIDVSSTKGLRRHASTPSPGISRTRNGVSDMSRSVTSPRSPPRLADMNTIRPIRSPGESSSQNMEVIFGPSFSSQPASELAAARTFSPIENEAVPPPPGTLASSPVRRRSAFDEEVVSSDRDSFAPSALPRSPKNPRPEAMLPVLSLPSAKTPPRSPPAEEDATPPLALTIHDSAPHPSPGIPASPRRSRSPISDTLPVQSGMLSPVSDRADRAPLSPSAAHGAVSANAEVVAYRPVSSASSVTSTGSTGSQPAYYRMLTSTAAERKRTVAACRALRAQISRFEEAFIQLHGRAPRGAAERAPLATTYAQYREWKRAIRADAACRIQALFRGARTRWTLLRINNPKIAKVVMKRPGRPAFVSTSEGPSMLQNLSIPSEIGEVDSDRRLSLPPNTSGGAEGYTSPHLPFQMQPRRRTSSGDGVSPQGPGPSPFGPGTTGSRSPTAAMASFSHLPLADLQARKRELKQQLKQYDMDFAHKHGRMPVKAEKEPIRHLYENYNLLKAQITLLEQDGQPVPAPRPQPMLSQRSPSPPNIAPTTSVDSAAEISPIPKLSSQRMPSARSRRKSSRSPPVPLEPPSAAVASTPTGAPSQDLAALKSEKGKLHQMLRSYEKDFFNEHRRQVSSFADIKPVASQYRRYKEIKKAIALLQEGGK